MSATGPQGTVIIDGSNKSAEILNPVSQKSHSSPTMTSQMTVGKLLQIVQQHVQQIISTHKLLTTVL